MREKWKTVSTRIAIADYDKLMEIAKKEGKTESDTLRLAISILFDAYPRFDAIKELLLSETMKRSLPLLEKEFLPIFSATIEKIQVEWNRAVKQNPKLKEVEKQFAEWRKKTKLATPQEVTEPRKRGRPKGTPKKRKDSQTVELMRGGLRG